MLIDPNGVNARLLKGLRCPSCNGLQPFEIVVTAIATIYDDGSQSFTDPEWKPDSRCVCTVCRHAATIREFKVGAQHYFDSHRMDGDALRRTADNENSENGA